MYHYYNACMFQLSTEDYPQQVVAFINNALLCPDVLQDGKPVFTTGILLESSTGKSIFYNNINVDFMDSRA